MKKFQIKITVDSENGISKHSISLAAADDEQLDCDEVGDSVGEACAAVLPRAVLSLAHAIVMSLAICDSAADATILRRIEESCDDLIHWWKKHDEDLANARNDTNGSNGHA